MNNMSRHGDTSATNLSSSLHLLSKHRFERNDTSMESGKFNASNADIKFRSSDGVEFNLHRTLLEAHTGGFPGPGIDTQGEVVQLSEPANVLAILFDFVYPKRHSDLVDTDTELVFALAEAVEKYEVFSAMLVCNARLSVYLPKYAERIFVHAVKHDYPKLMDKAAPLLPRSFFILAMEKLPACYSLPWSRYQKLWANVFEDARRCTMHIPLLPRTGSGKNCKNCHSVPAAICNICQNSMFLWITSLEEIETISSLYAILNEFPTHPISDTSCCKDFDESIDWAPDDMLASKRSSASSASSTSRYRCNHLLNLAKAIRYQIQLIPPFSDFVNGRRGRDDDE